jgi:hypothetical protein
LTTGFDLYQEGVVNFYFFFGKGKHLIILISINKKGVLERCIPERSTIMNKADGRYSLPLV